MQQMVSRLVSRASRGDTEAFGELYQRFLDPIYRYIYLRVGSHQDAEDLAEQVFIKAWRGLDTFRGGQVPFRNWLLRIAHNAVIDHYRRRRESQPLEDAWDVESDDPRVEEQVVAGEELERLARVIGRLPPLQQDVLALRFAEGLDAREIGKILDKNAGAVRVLQHRALKELYALWTAEEATGA